MSFNAADYTHMSRALQLAAKGLYTTDPNPRVGCVIVNNGEVVGDGWHSQAGTPHAEVHALERAGERAKGATVYVSLEPCCHQGRTGPCTEALLKAGVSRVVAAMQDPNPKVAGEGLAYLARRGVETASGLLQDKAEALNPGFIRRMRDGPPWLRLKLAMSLDGRTALAGGESRWITGAPARQDVHHWRARSSTMLTGSATIQSDNPRMDCRLDQTRVLQPNLAIVDTRLSTPPDSLCFQAQRRIWLFTTVDAQADYPAHVEVVNVPASGDGVDLQAVMAYLGQQEQNEIMAECGSTLAGALVAQKRVDEMILYLAGTFFGHSGRPLLQLGPLATMDDRCNWRIADVRAVGTDWRMLLYPG